MLRDDEARGEVRHGVAILSTDDTGAVATSTPAAGICVDLVVDGDTGGAGADDSAARSWTGFASTPSGGGKQGFGGKRRCTPLAASYPHRSGLVAELNSPDRSRSCARPARAARGPSEAARTCELQRSKRALLDDPPRGSSALMMTEFAEDVLRDTLTEASSFSAWRSDADFTCSPTLLPRAHLPMMTPGCLPDMRFDKTLSSEPAKFCIPPIAHRGGLGEDARSRSSKPSGHRLDSGPPPRAFARGRWGLGGPRCGVDVLPCW